MDHKIKTLESSKQARWNILAMESAQGIYCSRKGKGEGKVEAQVYTTNRRPLVFSSLLAFSITVFMGVRTVLELPMVGLTPVVGIACLDDKASLILAT